jgi:hypothetical protein
MVERQVFGAIDFTHPAAAEQRDQAIAAADNGPWSEPAGRWRSRGAGSCRRTRGRNRWPDGDPVVGW